MKKYLGIDFGGTRMRSIVLDEEGTIYAEADDLTQAEDGQEIIVSRLLDFISKSLEGHEVSGIGIGTPGPIDFLTGTILFTPNIPLKNVPIKQLIEERTGLPVVVERDANAALIGEHWMGDAKGCRNVAMLIWGTGIGGAIIIENKIFRGRNDMAGELGHVIIDEDGPYCNMGHNGCLESFIGGKAIYERYKRSMREIAQGARIGNEDDLKIIAEIGKNLNVGLKNLITLFDPELILIDGGCSKDFDLFLDYVKDMPVKLSKFAAKAGVIGAARVAMPISR